MGENIGSRGPLVPGEAIVAIVEDVVSKGDPVSFYKIAAAIHQHRNDFEPNSIENESAWVDAVAFDLTTDAHNLGPWRLYFGPNGSGTDGDGNAVYFPNVDALDHRTLDLWETRLGQAEHPAVKARYFDLLWELSLVVGSRKRNVSHARGAISSYETMVLEKRSHHLFDADDAITRMLSLALTIRETDSVGRATAMLLAHNRDLVQTSSPINLSVVDTLIWGRGVELTAEDKASILRDLEAVFAKAVSNDGAFDPFLAEHVADRLRRHYSRSKSANDVRRLHVALGAAFEALASLGGAMAAASQLDKAASEYSRGGDRQAYDRVRKSRAEAVERSRDEMTVHSTEISVTNDEMESFLSEVVTSDPIVSIVRTANLFPTVTNLTRMVRDLAQSSPLQAMISISIMEDEHVAAVIGSVEEDMEGRVMQMAGQHQAFDSMHLGAALGRLMERHKLSPVDIAGWAGRSGAYDDTSVIAEGVASWDHGDWIKCLHVLVPHIEAGVRRILKSLDQPIVKDHPTMAGRQVLLNMGEVLSNEVLQQAFGEDLILFFRARFVDPRARNLRNTVAHGLVGMDDASQQTCDILIHTLLVLGAWRELSTHRKKPPAT